MEKKTGGPHYQRFLGAGAAALRDVPVHLLRQVSYS